MKSYLARVVVSVLSDKEARNKVLTIFIVIGSIFFMILMIPAAILHAMNPFSSNVNYDETERALLKDDPYEEALRRIKGSERTDQIYLNLNFIRALESVVIYPDEEDGIEGAIPEEIIDRMFDYYLDIETKTVEVEVGGDGESSNEDDPSDEEEVDEQEGGTERVNPGVNDKELIQVVDYRAKSPGEVFDAMEMAYPVLASDKVRGEIIALVDFQKNVLNRHHILGEVKIMEDGCYYYGQPFGQYLNGGDHHGVDLPAAIGTPLYSLTDGKVISVIDGFDNVPAGLMDINQISRANLVIVLSELEGEPYTFLYGHLSPGVLNFVSEGEEIEAGRQIGQIGNSGYTSGPHLHLEIKRNQTQLVDPIELFDFGVLGDSSRYKGCGEPIY